MLISDETIPGCEGVARIQLVIFQLTQTFVTLCTRRVCWQTSSFWNSEHIQKRCELRNLNICQKAAQPQCLGIRSVKLLRKVPRKEKIYEIVLGLVSTSIFAEKHEEDWLPKGLDSSPSTYAFP